MFYIIYLIFYLKSILAKLCWYRIFAVTYNKTHTILYNVLHSLQMCLHTLVNKTIYYIMMEHTFLSGTSVVLLWNELNHLFYLGKKHFKT